MTKKKISKIFDKAFWGFIMMLPLLVYLVYIIKNGSTYSLESVFTDFGFGIDTTNVIFTTLSSLLIGSGSAIAGFTGNGIVLYITYISLVELIHLIVDCLLYIPRIAMKFLDKGVE